MPSRVNAPGPSDMLHLSNSDDEALAQQLMRNERFMQLLESIPDEDRSLYYNVREHDCSNTNTILNLLYALCAPTDVRNEIERQVLELGKKAIDFDRDGMEIDTGTDKVIEMERKLLREFRTYNKRLPLTIWHCCRRSCFAMLAADADQYLVYDELLVIHELAQYYREKVGDVSYFVQTRRKGIGKSNITKSFLSRSDRDPNFKTDRQTALQDLAIYVTRVFPFMCGKTASRTGVPKMETKLCSHAISCLLGVSNNFIYRKRAALTSKNDTSTQELYESIVDATGTRIRDHRRAGKRTGYPAIAELQRYDCGCEEPCLRNIPSELLQKWYNEFRTCSESIQPRRNENHFLLSHLQCTLMNCTVSHCNNSLSAVFTVSEARIASVRRILDHINSDPSLDSKQILEEAERGYRYSKKHPMSRFRMEVREKIETYLDMALRPDPGASDGVNVCRVYSPEINTQEKLRKLLADQLQDDEVLVSPMSSSTLQRMIQDYLDDHNCKLSFTQSDHNACPNCKSMQYAVLQFNMESKKLNRQLSCLLAEPRPFSKQMLDAIENLTNKARDKTEQEKACLSEMNEHLSRDARIRGFLKKMTDTFRELLKKHQKEERKLGAIHRKGWRERSSHAIMTHQDDMTKVDLPSFIVNASSDITRWRYDINAHVDAISGDSIVFSHEQGASGKDASSIFELILLDHILRCRGEGIKIIVSDNAAVGKNWITTIALPQYFVDQELADICIVVYLENNHGKWLADMLFGQLQLRKRRSTLPGVDALLSEFESINKSNGKVQGFVINPLACVNFSSVLASLGYQTKPSPDFCFTKRNIHFSTACAEGALNRLPDNLKDLIGEMLPSEKGMVRICNDAPTGMPQRSLPYSSRYFDVPAAANNSIVAPVEDDDAKPFLAVPSDQVYKEKGPCVVSSRNMDKVGYNGFEFRKFKAYPELQNVEDPLVKQTWPPGMLRTQDDEGRDDLEPINDSEFVKCAPENWIARRPVRRFRSTTGDFIARYPPRNMLNAKYAKAPRNEFAHEQVRWKPTATYREPAFPLDFADDVCAFDALRDLQEQNQNLGESITVLDLLKCIFRRMGNRRGVSDAWLQKPVTKPSAAAIDKYRKEVELFSRREKGHPNAPKTVKQFFRAETSVKQKIESIRSEALAAGKESPSANALLNQLFNETLRIPGGISRFESMVEKDLERYAREVSYFKSVSQLKFDEENQLLPVSSSGVDDLEMSEVDLVTEALD